MMTIGRVVMSPTWGEGNESPCKPFRPPNKHGAAPPETVPTKKTTVCVGNLHSRPECRDTLIGLAGDAGGENAASCHMIAASAHVVQTIPPLYTRQEQRPHCQGSFCSVERRWNYCTAFSSGARWPLCRDPIAVSRAQLEKQWTGRRVGGIRLNQCKINGIWFINAVEKAASWGVSFMLLCV